MRQTRRRVTSIRTAPCTDKTLDPKTSSEQQRIPEPKQGEAGQREVHRWPVLPRGQHSLLVITARAEGDRAPFTDEKSEAGLTLQRSQRMAQEGPSTWLPHPSSFQDSGWPFFCPPLMGGH